MNTTFLNPAAAPMNPAGIGTIGADAPALRTFRNSATRQACSEKDGCDFYQMVSSRPTLRVRYASMLGYCRSSEHCRCARFRAMETDGNPSACLLPTGEIDTTLSSGASRVLVVDDTPVFLKLMQGMVAAQLPGAEIVAVDNAQSALDALHRDRFALVVSDFHMPQMNGSELVARMRKGLATSGIPVIVLTTEDDPTVRGEVLKHSRTRWVAKGPGRETFAAAVHELLHEGRD